MSGGVEGPAGGGPAGAAVDPRVAEVLQQLRSGVRLRQAEAAVAAGLGGDLAGVADVPGGAGGTGTGFAPGLLAVRTAEYVQEPVAFSHRPRFGQLIVGSRKAFFHLFLKWLIRPLLAQQNAFNQAAGRLLQELAEANQRTAREVRLLAARVAELEARTAASAAAAAQAAAPQEQPSGGPAATRAAAREAAPADPPAAAAPPSAPAAAAGEGSPRR